MRVFTFSVLFQVTCTSETLRFTPPELSSEEQNSRSLSVWNHAKGIWKSGKAVGAFEIPSPLWIFGYGSLCWKTGFKYAEKQVGHMPPGWRRFFWQKSIYSRGTPSSPGLVLTVIPPTEWPQIQLTKEVATELEAVMGPGDPIVWGVCYRVADADVTEVIDQLDIRETAGYSHEVIDVRLDNGKVVRALVYAANRANPGFDCSLTLAQVADTIATSVGRSGSNYEYLHNIHRLFAASSGEDSYIARLTQMVQKRLPGFSPQSNAELKTAVNACLEQQPPAK